MWEQSCSNWLCKNVPKLQKQKTDRCGQEKGDTTNTKQDE